MRSIMCKVYMGLMAIVMIVFFLSESAVSGQEISDTTLLKTLYGHTVEKENYSSFIKNFGEIVSCADLTGVVE